METLTHDSIVNRSLSLFRCPRTTAEPGLSPWWRELRFREYSLSTFQGYL